MLWAFVAGPLASTGHGAPTTGRPTRRAAGPPRRPLPERAAALGPPSDPPPAVPRWPEAALRAAGAARPDDPESRRRFLRGAGLLARRGRGGRAGRALAGRPARRVDGPGRGDAARAGRARRGRCRPARTCRWPSSRRTSRRTAEFYRIDTALVVPQVDPDTWRLRIHGLVGNPIDADLRRPARPADGRAVRHADLRLQRGGRRPDRQRPLARRTAQGTARRGRAGGRRRPGGRPVGRRLDLRHAHRGAARRAGRAARGRHERRAAADRARLPGPDGRARPLRLRLGVQVGDRAGADQLRRLRRVLGAARLVRAGADQDAVPDRHAPAAQPARPRVR